MMRKNTLVDGVVKELRQMILTGEVRPGEFMPPRKDLAARFDVGLSTIHEAFQALAAVGMVNSRAGKGTWVRDDALDTIIHPAAVETRLGDLNVRQVYEARSLIEVGLTRMAARRATPADIRRIDAALAQMEAVLDDDAAFVEADLAFHLAVAKAARNDLLEQFYHLARKLFADVIGEMVRLTGVKEDAIRLQRAIAEAIASGDPEAAGSAARAHMRSVDDLLERF